MIYYIILFQCWKILLTSLNFLHGKETEDMYPLPFADSKHTISHLMCTYHERDEPSYLAHYAVTFWLIAWCNLPNCSEYVL